MSKKLLVLTLTVLLMACQNQMPNISKKYIDNQTVASNQVLIIYFDKDKKTTLLNAINKQGDEFIYDYQNLNGLAIKVKQKNIDQAIAFYQKVDGVLQVSKDEKMELH